MYSKTIILGNNQSIAIIGAGWYGSHLAIALEKKGYDVTLFEKNKKIFSGISGKFGIRIHRGPHYPRSKKTRQGCMFGYSRFISEYASCVNKHEYSIYGLGFKDAKKLPPKVNKEIFSKVCHEIQNSKKVDLKTFNYSTEEMELAFDVPEPSSILGEPLRNEFTKRLYQSNVELVCGITITHISCHEQKIRVHYGNDKTKDFDHVVNATSYKELLPSDPLPFEIVYQPCLALVYEDTKGSYMNKPFSFIVMDGWFPCLMLRILMSVNGHSHTA